MITSLYTNKNKYNIIRLLKQLIYKSIEQAYRTQNCFTVHKVLNPFDCLINKFLRIDTDISWDIRVIIHNSQHTDMSSHLRFLYFRATPTKNA